MWRKLITPFTISKFVKGFKFFPKFGRQKKWEHILRTRFSTSKLKATIENLTQLCITWAWQFPFNIFWFLAKILVKRLWWAPKFEFVLSALNDETRLQSNFNSFKLLFNMLNIPSAPSSLFLQKCNIKFWSPSTVKIWTEIGNSLIFFLFEASNWTLTKSSEHIALTI